MHLYKKLEVNLIVDMLGYTDTVISFELDVHWLALP